MAIKKRAVPLEDEVWRDLRKKAIDAGVSVGELVTTCLRRFLYAPQPRKVKS